MYAIINRTDEGNAASVKVGIPEEGIRIEVGALEAKLELPNGTFRYSRDVNKEEERGR